MSIAHPLDVDGLIAFNDRAHELDSVALFGAQCNWQGVSVYFGRIVDIHLDIAANGANFRVGNTHTANVVSSVLSRVHLFNSKQAPVAIEYGLNRLPMIRRQNIAVVLPADRLDGIGDHRTANRGAQSRNDAYIMDTPKGVSQIGTTTNEDDTIERDFSNFVGSNARIL